MKKRMNKEKWEKIVVVENREFRIKFWYDFCFYTSIEEKIFVKPSLFNKKGYYFEPIITPYWIDETKQNPIELALVCIKECLQNEKELNQLEKILDTFCQ